MSYQQGLLEVVDENDNIIGLETRAKIHKEGLLHREIHVSFFNPNGEIIFQRRSLTKDTYPGKLDTAVGGHVEPNMSYEQTAIKESKEETGIDIKPEELVFLSKSKNPFFDNATNVIHNAIDSEYAYLYRGRIEDLKVEKGEAEGFETWKIADLCSLSEVDKINFKPSLLTKEMLDLFDKAKGILIK